MPLFVCRKCGTTYLEDEDEGTRDTQHASCSRCRSDLVEACEWCNEPLSKCRCGKDEIKVE